MSFTIKIDHTVRVDGDTRLLWVLRDVLGMTGVVENRRWRSATARAACEVEVEILTPTEFLDQIAGSPATTTPTRFVSPKPQDALQVRK